MIFRKLYDNVTRALFPITTIKLPDKPIPTSICERYYIYFGKDIEGTITSIDDKTIVLKIKDLDDVKITEMIISELVDVVVVPYELNYSDFSTEKTLDYVFKIYCHLCVKMAKRLFVTHYEVSKIFCYAPIVLTLFTCLELDIIEVDSRLLKMVTEKYDIPCTEEFMTKIQTVELDRLLDEGAIIPFIEEYIK